MKDTVRKLQTQQDVYSYDPVTLKKIRLGQIHLIDYEGEGVARQEYHPEDSDRVYRLGFTSDKFENIDHATVMKGLVDRGYRNTGFIPLRGGLDIRSVWVAPDAPPMKDPILWDRSHWVMQTRDATVFEAVILFTSLRPGRSIWMSRGLFRMLCVNGLMHRTFLLGEVKQRHTAFDYERLSGELLDDAREPLLDVPLGSLIGTKKGLVQTTKLLRRADLWEDQPDETESEGTLDDENAVPEPLKGELPPFITRTLAPLAKIPTWNREGLTVQLETFIDKSKRDAFYALDMVNAVTNTINLQRQAEPDRALYGSIRRMGGVEDSLETLIGAYSL